MSRDMIDRAKAVVAMEFLARQVNDERLFIDSWLTTGVADGDMKYGELDYTKVDDTYLEDDTFRGLLDTFLTLMSDAMDDGGLYCGNVVSSLG